MLYPSLPEFLRLSRKGNLVPVYKEINADLDTPVSAFLKLRNSGYAFLLESVEGQEKIARYSFLGCDPAVVFESRGRHIRISYPHKKAIREFETGTDPLDEMKKIMQGFKAVRIKGLPRFYGGFVGYMGYDMVRFFEDIPDKNPDTLGLPDCVFMLTDTIFIFDHVNHSLKIVVNVMLPKGGTTGLAEKKRYYAQALRKIASLESCFRKPLPPERKPGTRSGAKVKIVSNLTKREFSRMVLKIKEYIKKGDIIQAVPSQRFRARISRKPFDIYRSLRSLNPSPYMFFLQLKGEYLVGASPEILVRCEDGAVVTRPIAGTRPRGKTEEEDVRLEKELLGDAKEKAEHIMLVDLGRNDLGRICMPGKVKVSEFMTVERYSHVMHLVTQVSGKLDPRYDAYDALRACFPAGTVSGAPKIRAMEIIDEVEPLRRGPYAGCVGYFSFSHNMDTCITLRTIFIKGNNAYIQAGAGIVADSKPGREYKETVNKAKALIEAIKQ